LVSAEVLSKVSNPTSSSLSHVETLMNDAFPSSVLTVKAFRSWASLVESVLFVEDNPLVLNGKLEVLQNMVALKRKHLRYTHLLNNQVHPLRQSPTDTRRHWLNILPVVLSFVFSLLAFLLPSVPNFEISFVTNLMEQLLGGQTFSESEVPAVLKVSSLFQDLLRRKLLYWFTNYKVFISLAIFILFLLGNEGATPPPPPNPNGVASTNPFPVNVLAPQQISSTAPVIPQVSSPMNHLCYRFIQDLRYPSEYQLLSNSIDSARWQAIKYSFLQISHSLHIHKVEDAARYLGRYLQSPMLYEPYLIEMELAFANSGGKYLFLLWVLEDHGSTIWWKEGANITDLPIPNAQPTLQPDTILPGFEKMHLLDEERFTSNALVTRFMDSNVFRQIYNSIPNILPIKAQHVILYSAAVSLSIAAGYVPVSLPALGYVNG
jgi:hypothetical protein